MTIDHLFSRDPWPHQRAGVEQTIAALSNGTKSVCLTAPTGSGKTAMEIALAKWQVEDVGKRVLCLTNRILLTAQTKRVFEADGVPIGVISSSMKHLERDEPIQIATIQTILSRRRSDPSYWVEADLVLADEIHQTSTGESADMINEYKARGSRVCGITATPLGVSNVCDELIVAGRTRDLQKAGILCTAEWYAPSELDTRQIHKGKSVDLSLSENDARKTWGPLKGDDAVRTLVVGNIIEHYQRLHPTLTHTLAFAPGVKESLWAAKYCTSRGFRSIHVDGDDFWVDGEMHDRKRDDRLFQDSLEAWREGHIPMLWNRFVLREGIDEPQIKCIILATPIGSYRSFLQMVGRGLRTHESKERCLCIDHGGAWWRHGSVNVNVDWESVFDCEDPDVLSKNRIAKQRETGDPMGQVCPKCGMVHKAFTRLVVCQYCGHQLHLGKPTRQIIQTDGKLTAVTGEPISQWKIIRTPECEKIWGGLYFHDLKHKGGEETFNQLYAQYGYRAAVAAGTKERPAYWKMYYPPRDLPGMPRNANDWHLKIKEVPRENLF
jgi:superfamily II DNA or RNA helicase